MLIETESPLNILISLSIAAEAHRAEVHFRLLRSKVNKLKSLKFRFGTRRPTVSKRCINNNNNNNNSFLYYYRADTTAIRPITETTQERNNKKPHLTKTLIM